MTDDLWNIIRDNEQLQRLEKRGFARGKRKGKTMDVPIGVLWDALAKQWSDLAYAFRSDDVKEMRRCLADLRNVAGCLFIKLDARKKKREQP